MSKTIFSSMGVEINLKPKSKIIHFLIYLSVGLSKTLQKFNVLLTLSIKISIKMQVGKDFMQNVPPTILMT